MFAAIRMTKIVSKKIHNTINFINDAENFPKCYNNLIMNRY